MLSAWHAGFELSKNKWGLTSAYSLSLSLHTGNSALIRTAGVETDPPGYPRASCLGVKQTTGGSTPDPPAIQTLMARETIIQIPTESIDDCKIKSLQREVPC
jgi:hypothetical protein